MKDKIEALRSRFSSELTNVADLGSLEELRQTFMSKKGAIQDLMKELGKIPNEQKKDAGQMINSFKQEVGERFEARKKELEELASASGCG